MLKMTILGCLGKDAEKRHVNGVDVFNFTVCSNGMRDGKQTKTWVQCSYWNPPPDLLQHLTMGTQVLVFGTPQAYGYLNNYREVVGTLKCNVTEVQVTHGRGLQEDKFAEMKEIMAQQQQETGVQAPADPQPAAKPAAKKKAAASSAKSKK